MRLAFREEGYDWICYLAGKDMRGATEMGRIKMALVVDHPEVKQTFISVMKLAFEEALKLTSNTEVAGWDEPQRAPESERSGHG